MLDACRCQRRSLGNLYPKPGVQARPLLACFTTRLALIVEDCHQDRPAALMNGRSLVLSTRNAASTTLGVCRDHRIFLLSSKWRVPYLLYST